MTSLNSPKYKTPVFKKNQPDDTYKFQPLPAPAGKYPYHLQLKDIVPNLNDGRIMFHMIGDTGGLGNPALQQLIADTMAGQCNKEGNAGYSPQFLYHLGDVVYHYGEAEQYDPQFFQSFNNYPCPIFAIAGNHDSDVNPLSIQPYKSLDAFTKVFCDTASRPVIFSHQARRKSMVQPNIYWTMETPLVTIIGLHSNVPKFGIITDEQKNWFINELHRANLDHPEKMLIVCIHHAPYSADINHGSSLPMINFLKDAFEAAGKRPDIVFSGHVHNYQRFCKNYADGKSVPFIIAGAGGFDELHSVATLDDERFTADISQFDDVMLMSYYDTAYGFLQITISKDDDEVVLNSKYFSVTHEETTLIDSVTISKSIQQKSLQAHD